MRPRPGWPAAAVRTAPAPVAGAAAAGTVASHPAPSAAGHGRQPQAPPGHVSPPVLPLTRHAEMLLPIVGCRLRPAIIARRCPGGTAAAAPGPATVHRCGRPLPLDSRRAPTLVACRIPLISPRSQRRAAAALLRGPAAADDRPGPPVRRQRPRTDPGRRDDPGRLPRAARTRITSTTWPPTRGPSRSRQIVGTLGRQGLGDRHRVRHRGPAQGRHRSARSPPTAATSTSRTRASPG